MSIMAGLFSSRKDGRLHDLDKNRVDIKTTASGSNEDICRVCRGTSQLDRPLFHPCQCTGSIKYIHQDCLVEWLKHSGKQVCELCQYQFQFAPIFRQDMPHKVPVFDLFIGIVRSTIKSIRQWTHLTFVSLMWLFIVPISVYRIFKFLLYDSIWSILKLPIEIFALEDILYDCIHGLLLVMVSLLGFISIVWLKDQLGNGLGPNWFEEDRREVNRVVLQEAQERVDLLRRHLEDAGARARERHILPDRVAVTAELTKLQNSLSFESNKLTSQLYEKYIEKLNRLKKREVEITYDLYGQLTQQNIRLLKSARRKQYNPNNKDPEDTCLTSEESLILKLYSKPPNSLCRNEKENLLDELKKIRAYQINLILDAKSYCNFLCKKMKSNSQSINQSMSNEDKIIFKILELKKDVMESSERESAIISRQHDEELMRREIVEVRMNRWYNRLLNRHQDDPLVLARRQRRNNRRPNIGHAIAGLARDHNPLDDEVGDNVDDLTWARLLGFDGSFRFLEHVFWLICLNSLFILVFVYVPFQIGYFVGSLFSFWSLSVLKNWTGVISVFIGYCILSVVILGFYYSTGKFNQPRIKNAMGVAYISIKVGLILAVEAGIFPLMCGWWIDICSLDFFNSTLTLRQESISNAPGTVMFLHWLAGMIFIFYLASFVMLLREVLRPGVLWFLRNLNDQNFHPINEMINIPLQRHLRRLLMSCVLFGVCVMVTLLIPSKIILLLSSSFLPYKFTITNVVSPLREIQIELILLQFIIPTLLEHGNCRMGFKIIVLCWAQLTSRIFGLQSYLLDKHQTGGVLVNVHGVVVQNVPYDSTNLKPLYTGSLQVLGPGFAPFKPYLRPRFFNLRIFCFFIYTLLSMIIVSTIVLTIPVAVGRYSLHILGLVDAPIMYTSSFGIYIMWLVIKFISVIVSFGLQGRTFFCEQINMWSCLLVKGFVAGILLFLIIPLLMGHIIELVLLNPLRVPVFKYPIFYFSTEWALGLLHTKCFFGLIWLTDVRFKRTLDAVYQAGIRNINLTYILIEVAWPIITILSLVIIIPYVGIFGILQYSGFLSYPKTIIIFRYFFPISLLLFVMFGLSLLSYLQCKKLYDHVRNEKYLIGRQLVNFK